MSKQSDFGAFLTGFFVGGLIGAGVALIFAPQSGEETREQIRQKGINLGEQASQAAEEARYKAEQALSEARVKLDEAAVDLQKRAKELQDQGKVLLKEKQKQFQAQKGEEETPAEGITLEDTPIEE